MRHKKVQIPDSTCLPVGCPGTDNSFLKSARSKCDVVEETVGRLLVSADMKIALAESCTGGLVMQRLSDIPGSSRYLLGGVVAYSNEVKEKVLGVPGEIIQKHGAVSEQTAGLMALGVRKLTGASLGLGITGIAGPGGGTMDKPVGTVYIALASREQVLCRRFLFSGERQVIRQDAATAGLVMILHHLDNCIDKSK